MAWLSTEEDASWLSFGDPFGTAKFPVGDCFGGYCGVTSNIDLSINEVTP